MAKKNLLESLVHSLTQSELKRFALHTKTYTSHKSYMDLFKAIKNNKVDKLEKNDNKYAQQRRYLYKIILESLIQKTKKTTEDEVLFWIKSANYLLRKQLPEHAYQTLNKAFAIVRKQEMIGYHLQIIEIEKQIRRYINTKGYRSDEEIFQEELSLIEQQKQLHTLKAVHNHILNYKKRYGYIDRKRWNIIFKEIKKMEAPTTIQQCYTSRAAYYYYFNQTLLFWIKRSHQKAYDFSSKMVLIKPDPLSNQEYLNGLLEHSTSCLCLGKTNEILSTLSLVKQKYEKGVFDNYDSVSLKIFYYRSNYELLSYAFMGQEENLRKKIQEIEEGIAYWGDKIPLAMKLILATGLKFGYASIGERKKMTQQTNLLIDNYKSGLRLDVYEDGLMWNLMSIFSKNDMDFLENQAEKAHRHFKKYKADEDIHENLDINFKIEATKLFLDYSRYLIDKKDFLTKFKQILEDKLSHFDNKFLEMDYPYLIWVNSEISNKSLLETAREMSEIYLNK